MSTNDLRAGQLLPDHLLEGPGHVTSTADRHLAGRPPAHHKSRSRGLANIDPKFTSQVRPFAVRFQTSKHGKNFSMMNMIIYQTV
jgi:hypothetical protein